MNRRIIVVLILISFCSLNLVAGTSGFAVLSGEDFKLDTVLLKFAVKEGESVSQNLKIKNLKSEKQDFQFGIEGVEGIAVLDKEGVGIVGEGVGNVKITFMGEEKGVYLGSFVVRTEKEERRIPILFEVQSEEVLFAVNLDIAPIYKEVKPGEKISVGVKLFNLNDTEMHDVEMSYFVKDFEGNVIVSETEKIVVGTDVFITKTISVPENAPLGDCCFIAIAKYGDSFGTSSYLFNIGKKGFLGFSDFNVNSFVLFIFVFLFGIVGLVIYMIHDRNKLILVLRRQHLAEMRYYSGRIKEKERRVLVRAKSSGEKKRIRKGFRIIKKKILQGVRRKYRERRAEIRKLRRAGRKSVIERKLNEWKKQGFNVEGVFNKTKKKSIEGQIKEWEKQGFNTSVLES